MDFTALSHFCMGRTANMVGEIRDLRSHIAIKAAQTGHMVMSTLRTNSAAEP
jgi:type II secretory ATPase GspE/PulE/Tfp pilus assembly ATPase PilB-like protein